MPIHLYYSISPNNCSLNCSKLPGLYFHSQTYNYSKPYTILLDFFTWYIGKAHKLSTSTLNLSNFLMNPVLHTNQTHYCPLSRLLGDSPDSIYLFTSSPELILYPLISTQFLPKSSPAIRLLNTHSSLKIHLNYHLSSNPLPTQVDSHSFCEFPLTPLCSKHFSSEAKMIITTIWEKRQ